MAGWAGGLVEVEVVSDDRSQKQMTSQGYGAHTMNHVKTVRLGD
jgi:hypothetical protein